MLLPAAAPQIRHIECIRITDTNDRHLWTNIPGTTISVWEGADAAAIVDLVARLPGSELMRCFVPRYGIRAHDAEGILFEIAFCFRCHGALVLPRSQREQGGLIGFDPDSQPAQELLGKFQAGDQRGTALNGDRAR